MRGLQQRVLISVAVEASVAVSDVVPSALANRGFKLYSLADDVFLLDPGLL